VQVRPKRHEHVEQESSRERLIRSAEQLFAEHGYHATSVRNIANHAGVNSALVGYYFRGKEGLLSEIYARHCQLLLRERERMLREFKAGRNEPTLEQVIEAFVRPSLEITTEHGRRSGLSRLRAMLSAENSSLLEKLVAQNFDRSSLMFVNAISSCVPHLSRQEVLWRFHFLLGTIYYTASGPHRINKLSKGKCDPSDPDATTNHLIPFLAAGFRTPFSESGEHPHRTGRRLGDRARPPKSP
jgi:AcrR family transcriptional regulator